MESKPEEGRGGEQFFSRLFVETLCLGQQASQCCSSEVGCYKLIPDCEIKINFDSIGNVFYTLPTQFSYLPLQKYCKTVQNPRPNRNAFMSVGRG